MRFIAVLAQKDIFLHIILTHMQEQLAEQTQFIDEDLTIAYYSPLPPKTTVKTATNHTFSPQTIVPITRNVQVNEHCYAVYSTLHKLPLAVHQFLDKTIVEGTATRVGKDFYQQVDGVSAEDLKFYVDKSFYERTNAYTNLSYDKGHMAPAKNYCGDQGLMDSTYTYANCVPQNSYFNRGSWKNLQSYCRNLLRQDICETIEIVSGPVFYSGLSYKGLPNTFQNKQVVMTENGIVVPPKCYKIVKANVGELSYLAAFVLDNDKKIDNQDTLKSCVVDLNNLEYMTGLRFNFGKCRSLQQLDPVGMAKTFGDLHLQFYTKLFKFAKTLGDMNGARKQGFSYHVKVDINCVPQEEKQKMGEVDYENIISEKDVKRTKARSRRKINSLLGLHRDATELNGLNHLLQSKIIKGIEENMQAAKAEQDKMYHKYIAAKLYKNNYGYHYPCEEELKKIFPNLDDKGSPQKAKNQEQNGQDSSPKPVKPKWTPKKVQQVHPVQKCELNNTENEAIKQSPKAENDEETNKLISQLEQVKIEDDKEEKPN